MSRVGRNAVYTLLSQVSVIGLGFVATRYIFVKLGGDALGLLYFSLTLSDILNRAGLAGISSLTVREVSYSLDVQSSYIHGFIKTAALFYWSLYAIALIVALLAAPWVTRHWINLTELEPGYATLVLRVFLTGALLVLPFSFYAAILRGRQDIGFTSSLDLLTAALRQLGTIVILVLGGSALQIAWWVTVLTALIGTVYLLRLLRTFPGHVLFRPKWVGEVVARNRSFAANMAVLTGLDALQQQVDKIAISAMLPLGYLGYYSFTYNTVGRSALLRAALASATLPRLTELHAQGNQARLVAVHRKLLDIQSYGAVPIFAALAFALKPLLTYTFSPAVAEELLVTGLLLILGFYLTGMNTPNQQTAVATGRPHLARKTSEMAFWITVPTAVLLIYWFGMAGAGYALLIRSLFGCFYLVPRIYRECLDLPASDWHRYWPRPLLLGAGVYGVVLFALFALGRTGLLELAGGYVAATTLFAVLAYPLVDPALTGQLRQTLLHLCNRYVRLPARHA